MTTQSFFVKRCNIEKKKGVGNDAGFMLILGKENSDILETGRTWVCRQSVRDAVVCARFVFDRALSTKDKRGAPCLGEKGVINTSVDVAKKAMSSQRHGFAAAVGHDTLSVQVIR